jgi:hypothetical protein
MLKPAGASLLPCTAICLLCSSCGWMAEPTATEMFRLRSECAALGGKAAARHPDFVVQQQRYDPRTNRCYVLLAGYGLDGFHMRMVIDAQTGEQLVSTLESDNGNFKSCTTRNGLTGLPKESSARCEAVEKLMADMMADGS